MDISNSQFKLINAQSLANFLDWEPPLILGLFLLFTWTFYFIFLKKVSQERHKNIKQTILSIFKNYVSFIALFLTYKVLSSLNDMSTIFSQALIYLAIICFIYGSSLFIKTFRLFALQYLFLGSIRHGVPLLIVNIISLILTILIFLFALSRFFDVQLAPLLATSAAFSVILGLALQDTLGNLFAGIALQVDKSFEIGDWLEVALSDKKTVGQVKEISWRSTTLTGFADEIIILPNRVLAQSQISNFSPPDNPILRSQVFRINFCTDIEKALEVLERSAVEIHGVLSLPAPLAFIYETTENGIIIKLVYYIENYGSHFILGGKVQRRGLELLHQAGFKTVIPKIEIHKET